METSENKKPPPDNPPAAIQRAEPMEITSIAAKRQASENKEGEPKKKQTIKEVIGELPKEVRPKSIAREESLETIQIPKHWFRNKTKKERYKTYRYEKNTRRGQTDD
jgi:hypothetical protein